LIGREFFQRDTLVCASDLIGITLIWGRCEGIIVESEAYLTKNDEASHTFSRPSTREFVKRNKPGAAYIYFNYGMHWMLNVLVKAGPRDGLILVRAIEPRRGIALMMKRRGTDDARNLCSGPGKLTQALDITNRHHEIDLCANLRYCFAPREQANIDVVADARIGISRSAHHPWRFTLRGSPFVSRAVRVSH
jgi:DNA-3-methyladenine glycosylase